MLKEFSDNVTKIGTRTAKRNAGAGSKLQGLREFISQHLRVVCVQSPAMQAKSDDAVARGKKPSTGTDQVQSCDDHKQTYDIPHARTSCRQLLDDKFVGSFGEKHNGKDVYEALASIDSNRKTQSVLITRDLSGANKVRLTEEPKTTGIRCDDKMRTSITQASVKALIATLKKKKEAK